MKIRQMLIRGAAVVLVAGILSSCGKFIDLNKNKKDVRPEIITEVVDDEITENVVDVNNDIEIDYDSLFPDEKSRDYAKLMIGTSATNFELTNLRGEVIKLSNLRGKNIVIEIGQPTCPSCIDFYPVLHEFKEDNPSIEVISIYLNADADRMDQFFVENEFKKNEDMIAMNDKTTIVEGYKLIGTPTVLFIDADGIIRYTQLGYTTRTELDLMAQFSFGKENVIVGKDTIAATID